MFPSLPASSRVWIFAADRRLEPGEQEAVLSHMRAFAGEWTSHGRPVKAETAMEHDRVLLVAAHIEEGPNAGVSGCGIDKMVDAAEAAATQNGFSWLDGLQVLYRDEADELRAVSRSNFREEVRQGRVTGDTVVMDTTITDLEALRTEGLARPAAASWHARVFRLAEKTTAQIA